MENSETELLFLSFLLLLTLLLSISVRLMSAQHPRPRPRRPKHMQIRQGSKRRTPQPVSSPALNSLSDSNESANIISKLLETGIQRLVQKFFPFYLRPWTHPEWTLMGGLSLPWFLKSQIPQNSQACWHLKKPDAVSADSDERPDRLIVSTDLFVYDQKYSNHSVKHLSTRSANPFQDVVSGFSSIEMKLSVRSRDLSRHELALSSKIHHSAGSPDLLRRLLRGKRFLVYSLCKFCLHI